MKGVMVSFHHLCGTLDPEAIPCKLTLSEVYHNRYKHVQNIGSTLFIVYVLFLIALQMRLCL